MPFKEFEHQSKNERYEVDKIDQSLKHFQDIGILVNYQCKQQTYNKSFETLICFLHLY